MLSFPLLNSYGWLLEIHVTKKLSVLAHICNPSMGIGTEKFLHLRASQTMWNGMFCIQWRYSVLKYRVKSSKRKKIKCWSLSIDRCSGHTPVHMFTYTWKNAYYTPSTHQKWYNPLPDLSETFLYFSLKAYIKLIHIKLLPRTVYPVNGSNSHSWKIVLTNIFPAGWNHFDQSGRPSMLSFTPCNTS